MNDFEFNLEDRKAKIKSLVEEYGENNLYVSVSGGKDSIVLHHLIDLALPNNKIPRIYDNTGIEYNHIVKYVKGIAMNDNRFSIIKPTKNIKQTLVKVGYPFKSKQHSHNLLIYKNNIDICDKYKNDKVLNEITERLKKEDKIYDLELIEYVKSIPTGANSFVKYWYGIRLHKVDKELPTRNTESSVRERESLSTSLSIVPDKLRFQFSKEYIEYLDSKGIYFSDKCCYEFKKDIFHDIEKKIGIYNSFTGMRKEEGGNRTGLTCITKSLNGVHLNPLATISDEWEEEFIKRYEIKLCELYYEPYNFRRQGCKFCPYSLDLQYQLDRMYLIDRKTYNQAIILWKPVYDEYIRIGYRLKYYPHERGVQQSIFDIGEE